MRKDSFVKFHFKAFTGFSVNRPNFAQKSSCLALNTREFHEDYKEILGFGNTEIKKMRKKKSGLVVSILVSHGLLVTEWNQETPKISWCLLMVREGSPGVQDTTRQIPLPPRDQETPQDVFVSPCLMLSPQENMRLQETTIPLLFCGHFSWFFVFPRAKPGISL